MFSSSWPSGSSSIGIRLAVNGSEELSTCIKMQTTPNHTTGTRAWLYTILYVCLIPHIPVKVDFVSQEEVNEAWDVLLRQLRVRKANVIECFEFG